MTKEVKAVQEDGFRSLGYSVTFSVVQLEHSKLLLEFVSDAMLGYCLLVLFFGYHASEFLGNIVSY